MYTDMHVSIFMYTDLHVSIIIHNFPCLWRYAVCMVCSSIGGMLFRDLPERAYWAWDNWRAETTLVPDVHVMWRDFPLRWPWFPWIGFASWPESCENRIGWPGNAKIAWNLVLRRGHGSLSAGLLMLLWSLCRRDALAEITRAARWVT